MKAGAQAAQGHLNQEQLRALSAQGVVKAFPKSRFRDFLRAHPDFSIHLVEKLIGRIRALTENVKSLALMDVYGRVARMLLEMAVKENGRLTVLEKLTQQDIANRVGASREMISRIFKDLTAGGYISIDKKQITIHKAPPRHW